MVSKLPKYDRTVPQSSHVFVPNFISRKPPQTTLKLCVHSALQYTKGTTHFVGKSGLFYGHKKVGLNRNQIMDPVIIKFMKFRRDKGKTEETAACKYTS